jgi:hypothetical protein
MTLRELALSIRMPRKPLSQRERALNWQKRNRAHCTAYKRQWRAAKRREGLCPT